MNYQKRNEAKTVLGVQDIEISINHGTNHVWVDNGIRLEGVRNEIKKDQDCSQS